MLSTWKMSSKGIFIRCLCNQYDDDDDDNKPFGRPDVYRCVWTIMYGPPDVYNVPAPLGCCVTAKAKMTLHSTTNTVVTGGSDGMLTVRGMVTGVV
jgi:hypothetical protein